MRTMIRHLILAAALSGSLAAATAAGGADLTVYRKAPANGLNPNDPAWSVPPATLTLANRWDWPDRHIFPSSTPRSYSMRAIHDGSSIFFRFEWNDATRNNTLSDPSSFADGCAIFFPMWDWTNPCTPAFFDNMYMGFKGWNPADFGIPIPAGVTCSPPYDLMVNIMAWKLNRANPQNLFGLGEGGANHATGVREGIPAAGTHSTPTIPPTGSHPMAVATSGTQNITGYANWAAGVWTVIMKRPMGAAVSDIAIGEGATTGDPAQFAFQPGKTGVPFSLANWEGQLQERANRKFTAPDWYFLDIQP